MDIRTARRNLVELYQFGEGSKYRIGRPGGRPELHYDFYAEGNKTKLVTPMPSTFDTKDKAFAEKFFGRTHKTQQEGLSAIALRKQYPALFSNIEAAPHPEDGRSVNVEYYDNNGDPWDQVASHSFAKGNDTVHSMVEAIVDHLHNKPFPNKKTEEIKQSGVILDCTYIDDYDYTHLWAQLIRRIDAATLRDRVVEINVPFAQTDLKKVEGNKNVQNANSIVDSCRVRKDHLDSFEIYNVHEMELCKSVTSLSTDIENIRNKKREQMNRNHPVFRNHNNFLPNNNSYFLEFYPTESRLPNKEESRLVWDQTNDVFYFTVTHYRPWISPYTNGLRHPFYRITH